MVGLVAAGRVRDIGLGLGQGVLERRVSLLGAMGMDGRMGRAAWGWMDEWMDG